MTSSSSMRPRAARCPAVNRLKMLAIGAAGLLLGTAAAARDIHYGAVGDAGVLTCDTLHWRGEIVEAGTCYGKLQANTTAAVAAEAAWALGDLQGANTWFRQAVRNRPDDAALRSRWGDLYAHTHQDSEAMNLYREALEIDDRYPFAMLGAARVLVGAFDEAANDYLEPLLEMSNGAEGARIGAWLLMARVALENGDIAAGRDALDEAEALVLAGDWPPLEIYALRAAADLLDNVADSEWTRKSLDYNAAWGGIYATPAHFHVVQRRYRDAIDLYQKAVEIEPGLASAHEELGVNLLRDNQVARARRHLEIAHDEDPFSPRSVNTLRLLDSFVNFEVLDDPPPGEGDGELPLVFRLHRSEASIIAPYAIELTRAAIEEFSRRYAFELQEPVVVEMYPDHEDFAVRTAGMPGLGILGATFGYVVAMDSPSGRPASEFQWGNVLWHELAHVFTLEATDHLVPRWFSEGVSVLEEWRSGPTPGVRIPMNVYRAMEEERFLPIARLDEGFLRPSYADQVIVSYMQAGLICRFIDDRFGPQALANVLTAFADGLQTPAALESALGMPTAALDDEFADYVEKEFSERLDHLGDWLAARGEAAERLHESDWDGAVEHARDAISLFPEYVEPDSPYLLLARAEEQRGDAAAAQSALQTFHDLGGYEPEALKRLAAWLEADGRRSDAIEVLALVNLVQPLDPQLHDTLGRYLLDAGRPREALREFEAHLALDPHDKATAYYSLARAHHQLGDDETSRDTLLLALDVAPGYRPAQRLLLELMRSQADGKKD